jgi:hypothetical protein
MELPFTPLDILEVVARQACFNTSDLRALRLVNSLFRRAVDGVSCKRILIRPDNHALLCTKRPHTFRSVEHIVVFTRDAEEVLLPQVR